MTTILAAIDHDDDTTILTPSLKRLVREDDELVLLGVAPRLSEDIIHHRVVSSAKRGERAMLEALASKTERVQSTVGVKGDIDLVSGAVAREIIKAAVLRKADMVVKEADRLQAQSAGRPGLVERKLIKRCPATTLILQKSLEVETPRIVVAIDNPEEKDAGGDGALLRARLMKAAIDLAKRMGAREITLLHAWKMEGLAFLQHPRSGLSEEAINQYIDEAESLARRWLSDFCENVESKYSGEGLAFKAQLVMGERGKAIAEAANALNCDVLVIGSANRRGMQGLFFGNTAESVVAAAACNLLVVKPEDFHTLL